MCEITRLRLELIEQISKTRKLVDVNTDLRRQLKIQNESLYRKNVLLDALHWVWCTGGCPKGVHRYTPGSLTEEIVSAAELAVRRMRASLDNTIFKEKWKTFTEEERKEWFAFKKAERILENAKKNLVLSTVS